MEELKYYLIENPFKEGRIAVTDRYSLTKTLKSHEEMDLKKTLHIPQEDRGKIYDSNAGKEILEAENSLQKMYEEEAGELLGLSVFSFGAGVGLTYLLFKPLFNMGAYSLPRYRIESAYEIPVEELPPHIINNPQMVDEGARFFSKIAGSTIGNLPFLAGLYYGVKYFRESRKRKRISKRIEDLKGLEIEIVPDEGASSFKKESEELTGEMRKYTQGFFSTRSRAEKLRICRKIQGGLVRMSCLTKTHGLDGANSYYESLEEPLYELMRVLKKPRFWKNEKKYIEKLFGGEK